MQSGRILPIMRQFFATATRTGNSAADRDPQQQSGGYSDRDATEEEARRAAEMLRASEEFKKNELSVEQVSRNGRQTLVVKNRDGVQLRVIQSFEIVKILLSMSTPDSPRQGRILDRRI